MKVDIEVTLTRERLLARVVGRGVSYDGPNRVALMEYKGRDRITAIGDDADDVPGARVIEGVAVEWFDPGISAGLVGFLGMKMWDQLHPGWRGPLGLLDSVDVRVSIERYDSVPTEVRRAFTKGLPYNPKITWWVDGEKVRD